MTGAHAVDRHRPALRIRGTSYPVFLPSWRDPRLHLAAVIVSLQVLGQVAFEFRLSIAQILVSLLTCAVLEVGIAFWRQRVILWPASARLYVFAVGYMAAIKLILFRVGCSESLSVMPQDKTGNGAWRSFHSPDHFHNKAVKQIAISVLSVRARQRFEFILARFSLGDLSRLFGAGHAVVQRRAAVFERVH